MNIHRSEDNLQRSPRIVASAGRVLVCALVCIGVGCKSEKPAAKAPTAVRHRVGAEQPNDGDACAARLHDISGVILFYYVAQHHLPPTLDDLHGLAGFEDVQYACPVSGLPYIYSPAGLPAPNQPGAKVIVYDATPAHSGMRLAISIIEPTDGTAGALVTKVIAVPQSYFTTTQPTP